MSFTDQTWQSIERWAQQRLEKARQKNEDIKLDHHETSVIRGEIRVLKELLALPKHAEAQAWMDEPQ